MRGEEKLPCALAGAWDKELSVTMPNGTKRKIWQTYAMPKAESRCGGQPAYKLYAFGAAEHHQFE